MLHWREASTGKIERNTEPPITREKHSSILCHSPQIPTSSLPIPLRPPPPNKRHTPICIHIHILIRPSLPSPPSAPSSSLASLHHQPRPLILCLCGAGRKRYVPSRILSPHPIRPAFSPSVFLNPSMHSTNPILVPALEV